MKKNQKIGIIVFAVAMLMAVAVFYSVKGNKNGLTEPEAISLLKDAYPEFKNLSRRGDSI